MQSQLKEKMEAHVLEALFAGLGTAIPAWLLIAEESLSPLLAQLQPSTVIRSVAALLLIALWAVALFLFFRPRLKFEPKLGVYRDLKSGFYYCPSCYAKKLRSPMREQDSGWRCVVKECKSFFANPDYKNPDNQPQRRRIHGGIYG